MAIAIHFSPIDGGTYVLPVPICSDTMCYIGK